MAFSILLTGFVSIFVDPKAFALTFVSAPWLPYSQTKNGPLERANAKEIGDKTFFIAAILAAGSSAASEGLSQKVLTFIGAILALGVAELSNLRMFIQVVKTCYIDHIDPYIRDYASNLHSIVLQESLSYHRMPESLYSPYIDHFNSFHHLTFLS